MASGAVRPSIYGLFDSEGQLRYVGKAINPAERLKGHMREVRRRKTPLYCWLAKHGVPRMEILETECHDWETAERAWISSAKQVGCKLLNVAEGGNEPECSKETRSKNGYALAAKIGSDPRIKRLRELKASLRRSYNQGYMSDETVEKMHNAARRAPHLFGDWLLVEKTGRTFANQAERFSDGR